MSTMANQRSSWLKYEECDNQYSRDDITVILGQNLSAGTVIGKITRGATTVGTVTFAGTGNGTCTKASTAYSVTSQNGSYTATCVEKTTDSGLFSVKRPDGTIDGYAVIGTAYDGQVKFTIADGATDFAQGDTFTVPVTVADGSGKFTAFDPTATDGSQTASGILLNAVNAVADSAGVAIVRLAILSKEGLTWGAGVTTAGQKTAAYSTLKAMGILTRAYV